MTRRRWRSLPGQRDSRPRRLREALDVVASRFGAPGASTMSSVFSHWDEAVGPGVAGHARPHSLVDGVLTVEVEDPAWATQLTLLESEIRASLNTAAGATAVHELRVRVTRRPGR